MMPVTAETACASPMTARPQLTLYCTKFLLLQF